MKKQIAALLAFVFTFQISTTSFAQSNAVAEKKELVSCYNQLFDQSSKAISKSKGKEIELTAQKRLSYLQIMTFQLMNNIASDEKSDAEAVRVAAIFLADIAIGGVVIGAIRHFQNKPLATEYGNIKSVLRTGALDVNDVINLRIIPKANYLNQEIVYKAGTSRYLLKAWIGLTVVLLALTLYLSETREDFSEHHEKVSFMSLLGTTSVEDFENKLFISSDPTSLEIGHRLLKSCKNVVKQDMTKVMKDFESFTNQELVDAVLWMGNPSKN